jgi:hypothetical protein
MRSLFTGRARNRSWRPSWPSVGFAKSVHASITEEATGASEVNGQLGALGGRKRHRMCRPAGRRSGKRAVKRESPQSRLHRAAPSFPVPGSRVFGRASRPREKRRSRGRARSREAPEVSDPRAARARKGRPRTRSHKTHRSLRWETTKRDGCSSWKRFRSAEVDRAHRRSRRLKEEQSTSFGNARPSSQESPPPRVTRGSGEEIERRRCAGFRCAFQREDARGLRPHAQASSGSHPEGCGLGDSGSSRATSARSYGTTEGCRARDSRLSKSEMELRLWLRR